MQIVIMPIMKFSLNVIFIAQTTWFQEKEFLLRKEEEERKTSVREEWLVGKSLYY